MSGRRDEAERPSLRVKYDPATGAAVCCYVGSLDITHLVTRVQSNTFLGQTTHEVVLCSHWGPMPRQIETVKT